jgi:hypothetical protein
MAANECVLNCTRDSDVPPAELRAYYQCTVQEIAKQLSVQEINKYGDAEPAALPLAQSKDRGDHGRMLPKARNQYPEFKAWAADK